MRALLHLAYDGTDFRGCPELPDQRTICGELAGALRRLGEPVEDLETLSRTDSGVHARCNVAHASLTRSWTAEDLLRALASQLPEDLAVVDAHLAEDVPSVVAKRYRYTVDVSPRGDPFAARWAWRPPRAPELSTLQGLAPLLVGQHDFVGFRRRGEQRVDCVRTVRSAAWVRDGDRLQFDIVGDGFIYHLVRSLVGAMVVVALGARPERELSLALSGVPGEVSRQLAPARGLHLMGMQLAAPLVGWPRCSLVETASQL